MKAFRNRLRSFPISRPQRLHRKRDMTLRFCTCSACTAGSVPRMRRDPVVLLSVLIHPCPVSLLFCILLSIRRIKRNFCFNFFTIDKGAGILYHTFHIHIVLFNTSYESFIIIYSDQISINLYWRFLIPSISKETYKKEWKMKREGEDEVQKGNYIFDACAWSGGFW